MHPVACRQVPPERVNERAKQSGTDQIVQRLMRS